MKKIILSLTLLMSAVAALAFDWGGATVYFVITDRFLDGDPTNNQNYGRITDYGEGHLNAATFHGGDLAGLLQKAKAGYFTDLGIDVLWMTDVYEQIHGWMSGSGNVNDFPHYGYHGYYPLDYTQMDKNYGTMEELRELVDTLHAQGIRVMLGANINDPGYPTLLDAVQCGFADTGGMTAADAARHHPEWSYDQWAGEMATWDKWWTSEWLRMPGEGWDENNPLTCTLYGLPDFKTEKTEAVKIPEFLKDKWANEGKSNEAWVNPSALPYRKDGNLAPADYVIKWIASWVEELGIDGFRCDIVEYVHLPRWKQLSEECTAALNRWRSRHPDDPAAKWTDPIYLTGDFDYADIDYKPEYADAGFSSMVNFYFPKHGDLDNITYTWQAYSDSIAAHPDWHPFSYLNNSYHRDADASNMIDCGTALLLSPGTIQVFYGDETGRKPNADAALNVDSDQSFRSDMNWDAIDTATLHHYSTLGKIRRNNPVIATGKAITIDTHTQARVNDKGEKIIIRVCPEAGQPIPVSQYFKEGSKVTDLYTGATSIVKNGGVTFDNYSSRVAVLKNE